MYKILLNIVSIRSSILLRKYLETPLVLNILINRMCGSHSGGSTSVCGTQYDWYLLTLFILSPLGFYIHVYICC